MKPRTNNVRAVEMVIPRREVKSEDEIRRLEERIVRVESILILLTVGAIAWGDYLLGPYSSIGYLYLVPLSYSALTHRLRTTLGLLVLCIILRQLFGPLEFSTWVAIARDWILTAVFLSVVAALNRLGRERRDFFDKASTQRDELVAEIELAAEVQSHLLNENLPPSGPFEIVARTVPAKVVGGDYYDFIALPDGKTGIVIADVSGKGLSAAMVMPAVQIALRTILEHSQDAREAVRKLSDTFYESLDAARYVTLFFGVLDQVSGHLCYINAGHQPVLLLRAADESGVWLERGGTPIGLLPDAEYESGELQLRPADVLVFYTDGVVEASDLSDEQFGNERLLQVVRENRKRQAGEIVQAVHAAAAQFCAGRSPDDDVTVIVVRAPNHLGAQAEGLEST